MTSTNVLEGITEKSTKAQLLDRLRDAAKRLAGQEDARVAKLQEIEERVRAKYTATNTDLRQVLCTATKQEWQEIIDFFENFGDVLPPVLKRFNDGAKAAVQFDDTI